MNFHVLKEVYEIDKSLHHEGYRSWYSFIQNSMHKLNVRENTYSKLYDRLQFYLLFGFPKSLTKELTKNRISVRDLLIERGRYFRLKIPREQRICVQCNLVEDEEHFFLRVFCSKYILFNKLHLNIPVLRHNTN